MTKGFVLTLDAVLAATVALVISILIMGMLSATNINYYGYQELSSVGNDLLAILDLTDVLDNYTDMTEAQGSADLLSQLDVLPNHYCSNASVRVYHYNSGFQLDKTFSATKTGCTFSEENSMTKIKRMYVDLDDQKYGLGEMELWLK